jgi:G:T/U-mismatch repair DNA glycosylase
MLEIHPFGPFFPEKMHFIITGTFPGRKFAQRTTAENEADEMAFSYAGRNLLWKIFSDLYQVELITKTQKKAFLSNWQVGLLDLYNEVERLKDSNLDTDLKIISTNQAHFARLFESKQIEKVFCTGKGVAQTLQRWFPDESAKIIALPSPSPAARLPYDYRLAQYKTLFVECVSANISDAQKHEGKTDASNDMSNIATIEPSCPLDF